MRRKRTREESICEAARAHTSLCLLAAAVNLLENSDISSDYYRPVQKIIKTCQKTQQRCLRDYDRAVAAALIYHEKN